MSMQPYWQSPDVSIYHGDAREVLAALKPESVQLVVTSPPYAGLRKYLGVPDSVWGGDPECQHIWSDEMPPFGYRRGNKPGDISTSTLDSPQRQDTVVRPNASGRFCQACSAWLGTLGNEPVVDCGRAASKSDEMELRPDLSDEERAYVISELLRLGVIR